VRPGDVVVEFNGSKIREVPDLQRRVASVAPGETVKLTVVRDAQMVPVSVAIGEMPAEDRPVAAVERETEGLGMQVEALAPGAADRLGLPVSEGLVVIDVASGGPADRAGLRRGDVILEVARRPVTDVTSLNRALAAAPTDSPVLLYVHRPGGGGRNQYVVLERGARP
jgi:serine protease Do